MAGQILGLVRFTDGVDRPVYQDDRGQYVVDEDERVDGVWDVVLGFPRRTSTAVPTTP